MCSESVNWTGCHDNAAAATVGSFGATVAHHGDAEEFIIIKVLNQSVSGRAVGAVSCHVLLPVTKVPPR